MSVIFFDIETAPPPEAELAQFMPQFEPPSLWKDPAKIEAYIAKAKAQWIEEAALDAMTCRVLAVGIRHRSKTVILDGEDEPRLLNEFWKELSEPSRLSWVSFGGNSFDLPVLMRRSWKWGIAPPHGIRQGRYWENRFIDLRETWCCGDRYAPGSLDSIARFFSLPGKTGTGANFAKLYASDPEAARAYLSHDLELIESLYDRMLMPL